MALDNGIYNGIWNRNSLLGFEKGKKYTFKLDKPKNECYNIEELNEGFHIVLASEISIKRYFKNLKKED